MSITAGTVIRSVAGAAAKRLIYGGNVALIGYEVGKIVHEPDQVRIATVTEKVIIREKSTELHTYILLSFIAIFIVLLSVKLVLSLCKKYKTATTITNTQTSIELGQIQANFKPEPKQRQYD